MPKARSRSPFLGRWRITEMSEWGRDYVDMEVKAFIEFRKDGEGQFQFGLIAGTIDYRLGERDGGPAMEWTWEGNDECDPIMGRGWAVLANQRTLLGHLFFHQGDDSSFRAKRFPAAVQATRSHRARPKRTLSSRKRRTGNRADRAESGNNGTTPRPGHPMSSPDSSSPLHVPDHRESDLGASR